MSKTTARGIHDVFRDSELHLVGRRCYLTFLYKELPRQGGDRVDLTDEELVTKARNNSMEDFAKPFAEALGKVLMHMMKENDEFFETVGGDKEMLDYLNGAMLKLFYEKYRG